MVEAVWDPVSEKTAFLDSQMVCKDLEDLGSRPLDLILELTAELKSNGKDLNFRKFNGIEDLEKLVKELTE